MPKLGQDSARVVVVGSVHMDLIASAPRLPNPGESVLGLGFAMCPGGKGGNQAIAAAQQGAVTAIVARVGDDTFGNQLRESLARKDVDVSQLQNDAARATGVSPVLMGAEGEYASIIVPGASLSLTPDLITPCFEVLRSCAVLMLQMEIGLSTSAAAARVAASGDATVVVNASPAPALPDAVDWELWSDVDVLIVNRDEAEVLSNVVAGDAASGVEAAAALRQALGIPGVIVTLGRGGAALADSSGEMEFPGYAVTVEDTIGAGDAFAGAVAAALTRGLNLREAVWLGNAAGALAVGRKGAYDAAPTLEETELLASSGGGDFPWALV
jgi:ribokinase